MKTVTKHIDISTHPFDYTLVYHEELPEGICKRNWERCAGTDELLVVQVNVRPAFLGVIVSKDQCAYGKQYLQFVIARGALWDVNRGTHLLIDLRAANPIVYRSRYMIRSHALSRALVSVHAALMHEMYRYARQHDRSQATFERLAEIPFFSTRINPKTLGQKSIALAHARKSDAYTVVYGDVDETDALQLARVLVLQRNAPVHAAMADAGNCLVCIDGGEICLEVEGCLSDDGRGIIIEFIQNVLSIVVVSDTQMGGEKGADFFGEEKERDFISLIDACGKRSQTVLLNGDFLGLDIKRGNTLEAIVHNYGPLFEALRKVRRLIYVVGNHDAALLHDEAVRSAFMDVLPNCEIWQTYEAVRGSTRVHFEHGHIQTGVYQKWYTSALFATLDTCHDIMESIKIACTRNKLHFPGVHMLFYITELLLLVPFICQMPIRFFVRRELSRTLALVRAYHMCGEALERTIICCGHIHNLIGPDEGWVNMFLQDMMPAARYMNSGAWNASILQDELFKKSDGEVKAGQFLDWDDPRVKKDWLVIQANGAVVHGSGVATFLQAISEPSDS